MIIGGLSAATKPPPQENWTRRPPSEVALIAIVYVALTTYYGRVQLHT